MCTKIPVYPNPMSVSYFFREFILSKAAAEQGDNSVSKKAESQQGHPKAQQDDKSLAKQVESKQNYPNAQQGDKSVSKKREPRKGNSNTRQGDDSGPKKAMSKQGHSNTNDFYMFFVRFVLIECLVIVLHYSIFGKL